MYVKNWWGILICDSSGWECKRTRLAVNKPNTSDFLVYHANYGHVGAAAINVNDRANLKISHNAPYLTIVPVRRILRCNCRMPYSSASAVGGQPGT
jgi:hypothetical protein